MSQFRADILDNANARLGAGSLTTIHSLTTLDRLDEVGAVTFAFPAGDPRGSLVAAGRRFDLWSGDPAEYLGRFIYSTESLTVSQDEVSREVTAYNLLRELTQRTVGFRRSYVNINVDVVVEDLMTVLPDWDTNLDTGIGQTVVGYEGESVLAAIDVLRDRWGQHFRLDNPTPGHKILEFGAFGQSSGIRAIQAAGQVQHEFLAHGNVCVVEKLGLVDQSDEIYNRIIPLGAGQGVNQLTIEQATLGSYAVQQGTNADGSVYFYIEDAASVASYGRVDKVLSLSNLRPITNSDANIENAANTLKLTAEAYLARHLAPRSTYSLTVRGLKNKPRVGDTIRVVYRGMVEAHYREATESKEYVYVDLDDDLYILDIEILRQLSGDSYQETVNLTVSTVADRRTSDQDILLDVIRDIRALKVHIAPNLARPTVGPYVRQLDSTHTADFTIDLGEETMFLNYAILRFTSRPFRTLASGVSSGGASTPTSDADGAHDHIVFPHVSGSTGSYTLRRYNTQLPSTNGFINLDTEKSGTISTFPANNDHTHDVSIPSHTHNLSYGINDDTTHPQDITVKINGVDVTSPLGGPWADSNDPVDIEVDITEYLVNAVGGLRQKHTVEFSCGSGQGEIEFQVRMLTTIQAIAAF